MSESGAFSLRRRALQAVLFVALVGVVAVVVEGLASTGLAVYEIATRLARPNTETRHARYDPELGWVNVPGIVIEDLFGPGKSLRTNSQGFRNREDFPATVPAGTVRVICLGDSFTLGHGVGDDSTWCQVLRSLDPRLETVNMGQGGYGIDQAFLWYMRDGVKLEHQVLLFAFITDDFRRMQLSEFMGYGKPVLALERGTLVQRNVPVPRGGMRFPWLAQNGRLADEFRTVQVVRRLTGSPRQAEPGPGAHGSEVQEVATHVFDAVKARSVAHGVRFVLVCLPARWDYRTGVSDPWRRFVRDYAVGSGVAYVDLVEELRRLDGDTVATLYIGDGQPGAPHLTEAGNAWVAGRLFERVLRATP